MSVLYGGVFDDDSKRTPLAWAAYEGRMTIVKELVEKHGAAVDKMFGPYSVTPLYYTRSTDVLELLVSHGASVNGVEGQKATPAHGIARWGCVDALRRLRERGGAVDVLTKSHGTPLLAACVYGHLDVVHQLLSWRTPSASGGELTPWACMPPALRKDTHVAKLVKDRAIVLRVLAALLVCDRDEFAQVMYNRFVPASPSDPYSIEAETCFRCYGQMFKRITQASVMAKRCVARVSMLTRCPTRALRRDTLTIGRIARFLYLLEHPLLSLTREIPYSACATSVVLDEETFMILSAHMFGAEVLYHSTSTEYQ